MYKLLLISFVSCASLMSMNVSFENLYFILSPQAVQEYPPAYCVLLSAIGYDVPDKEVLAQGRQRAFINYLFRKKGLSIEAHPRAWSQAIEIAAKAGNVEGLRVLLELGVEKKPRTSCAISQAVSSWLFKKQLKKSGVPEKRTDQIYLDVVKMLLSYGFSPHMLKMSKEVRPFKLALKHEKKLPGLIDVLVLYADPNDFIKKYRIEYSLQELQILMAKYTQKWERVPLLRQDRSTYFSLLLRDLQEQVALYDFQCDYHNLFLEVKTMEDQSLSKQN